MARLVLLLFVMLTGLACARTPLPRTVGETVLHEVRGEENLYTIALRHGLAVEHLAFANDVRPVRLGVDPGTLLTIPAQRILPRDPPRDGIVVNLPERGMYLFRGGRYQGFYPVAIGMPGRYATPRGNFHIVSRVANPTWLPPAWAELREERVGPGPANPLGDRWMGLNIGGVGIHSTNNPVWVGDAVTHACLRLYPAMAHKLFEQVRVGLPVRIEYHTARLGVDPSGALVLATFPDVYGLADPLAGARRLLRAAGREMRDDALRAMALPPRGLPTVIFPQ